MAAEAGRAILGRTEHRPDALVCANMLSGILSNQQQLGALVASDLGLDGVEAWTTEAACGSGAVAMINAIRMIRSGDMDSVLVIGVEAMTHVSTEMATAGLATAAERESESSRGETFVTLNAKLMQAYMDAYSHGPSALSPFSINAHANAIENPHAVFRKAVDLDTYEQSPFISGPLRLYDASPTCDGAAAVLLSARLRRTEPLYQDCTPVELIGYGVATDAVAVAERANPLALAASARSFEKALSSAGIHRRDIDLFELHDAYSIMAALSLEACGFCSPGEAPSAADAGEFSRNGTLPIATFGGLKSRGHPVGATGVYQVHEAALQVSGQAKGCQVDGARIAATQNIGGTGSTVGTIVMRR